ncbi:hypothetical protein RPD_3436 [Rhodopseudomonas palustris BisB5]|uniref:Rap1a immunity protein domain-containing protein n=1 Tax=Rhodopseudomonas palustris (strain BisB5) TaxID=316057 RepID=Q133T0_RHOPS|nr:hypothetical protein RPD_3436 [Rhodopseudomonas palustris BisB5]
MELIVTTNREILMRLYIALSLLGVFNFANPVLAGSEFTGNELLVACNSSDEMVKLVCRKYIAGIAQGMRIGISIAGKNGDCLPDQATETQLTRIAVKFMTEAPEHLHYPAAPIVALGLRSVFKCPTQ